MTIGSNIQVNSSAPAGRFRDFHSTKNNPNGLAYGNNFNGGGLDFYNEGQFGQGGGASPGMKNFSLGANAFVGLAGAYNAYQLRELGEEQFGIEKKLINRNVANDSLAYNDEITQRVIGGLRVNGIEPGTPEYQAAIANVKKRYADGSPIAG